MNLTKITIGQYYNVNSKIHLLDPRLKFISTIVLLSTLFIANNLISFVVIGVFVYVLILLSKVPVRFVFRGVRAISYIIFFTMVINVLFAPGSTVVFYFWVITITQESLIWALQMSVRLVMILVISSILTLTTSPINLTSAIENLLSPLKKVRIPAHEIAMMMTIALRFIPTLLEETEKIMKAQSARGASFDTDGIIKRIKNLVPIIVPLFVSSFRRADDLAMAMEARCYRGDINRTKMKVLKYDKRDFIAFVVVVSLLVIVVILGQI